MNGEPGFKASYMKKMTAPILISLLVLGYYTLVVGLLFRLTLPSAVKAILVLVPLGVAVGLTYVLFERSKEIRSGEEDDLSKY